MSLSIVPTTPLRRKSTTQTLHGVAMNAGRRGSFIMELRDQLQTQHDGDVEAERLTEVRAIHRILRKAPETRDATDIDVLYEFVLQNGSTQQIFAGAQEIICKTICREMTLLELPAHGVVCYQGDYGDTFFVIIDGAVSLYIDSKKSKLLALADESSSQSQGDQYLQTTPALLGAELSETVRTDSDGDVVPETYGAFIKQIGAGGTFGELAVMDPTARRSCTITCDAPTSFICLKRGAYQRLIRITNSSHLDFTTVEYLETLYFFTKWPHGELTRLANRLRHLTFSADTYLTRVGSDANVVFFIYAGVVQESIPLVHHLNANGTVYKCARFETGASKRSVQEAALATSASSVTGIGSGAGSSGSSSLNSSSGGSASRFGKDNKQQQLPQTKRIALELNVYQDHDVCGEFPVLLNKHVYTTDLLALTDVKTLIMDRETWKELFFMHGLEHIRNAYNKLKALAEARETWRQTRTKLALANPGLVLTLSTKAMMHDGKCTCGWCGSCEHITGDAACAVMAASKKQQADKHKRGKSKAKRAFEMAARAQAVARSLAFGHIVGDAQPSELRSDSVDATTATPTPRPPSSGSARRSSFQVAAKQIVSSSDGDAQTRVSNQDDDAVVAASAPPVRVPTPPQVIGAGSTSTSVASPTTSSSASIVQSLPVSASQLLPSSIGSDKSLVQTLSTATASTSSSSIAKPIARKAAIKDVHRLSSDSRTLYAREMQQLADPHAAAACSPSPLKLEAVRASAFPEYVASCYRETLVRQIKRVATRQDYLDVRADVLDAMQTLECTTTAPADRMRAAAQLQPRKPPIPKPMRLVGTRNSSSSSTSRMTQGPRPDRFNRKINRVLRRLRLKEHPLPVVEESLK